MFKKVLRYGRIVLQKILPHQKDDGESVKEVFNMNKEYKQFSTKELPIPIYLNQETVFNLMAIFEDGFSKLTTLKTSSQEGESNMSGMGASIGASNVFALLGISLSAEKGKEKQTNDQTETSQEKVHTPTSLFAKCRDNLIQNNLLRHDLSLDNLPELKTGEFVEIKAALRKNPIQDVLEWGKAMLEMIAPFANKSPSGKNSSQSKKQAKSGDKETVRQIDAMISMVAGKDTVELVGDLVDQPELKAVITCQTNFFNRGNTSEIVDGEFIILGKVVQIAREDSESINLLRNTALGRLQSDRLNELTSSFASLEDSGFERTSVSTNIEAPAILIFPIAIYI